jgi:hypothetical protein
MFPDVDLIVDFCWRVLLAIESHRMENSIFPHTETTLHQLQSHLHQFLQLCGERGYPSIPYLCPAPVETGCGIRAWTWHSGSIFCRGHPFLLGPDAL